MEPLTEHRGVNGPVVYGFLRLVKVSEPRHSALAVSLAEYCRQHELLLSAVFADRTASEGPGSAAFTGLLDVLALPDTYGVVLPAASHLGPRAISVERVRQIDRVGARILLLRQVAKAGLSGQRQVTSPSNSSHCQSHGLAAALDAET
ncbi:hypothetical protein [Streptomyces sp. H39-C1]|uniref:hypothetical protein n=1 Tax=Streptomyces sp. H39-C1 TaxID=3004355 RepID=UPI0022AE8356|nr:hypothetical protein [Streptomyces sp. H39-C1]MCZ4102554.1 hypothetical protein [Streptomyces sp. H39-C1]